MPAGELPAEVSERLSETVPPGDTTPGDRVKESVWPEAMVHASGKIKTAIVDLKKLWTMAFTWIVGTRRREYQ